MDAINNRALCQLSYLSKTFLRQQEIRRERREKTTAVSVLKTDKPQNRPFFETIVFSHLRQA
jgi:hypothetical protein